MDPKLLGNSWVEVNLDVVHHNVTELKDKNGNGKFMAVIKGDAYGHGAIPVAKECLSAGADRLGVANVWEGVSVRRAGIDCPILVLSATPPVAVDYAVQHDLTLTVFDQYTVGQIQRQAKERDKRATVHIKVDSGMSRLGIRQTDEIVSLAQHITDCSHVFLQGMYTHLAEAETEDKTITFAQFDRFNDIVNKVKTKGISPGLIHVSNSAAAIEMPELACDFVRPGLSLFGHYPSPRQQAFLDLKPALCWKSYVSQVKSIPPGTGVSYNLTWKAERDTLVANIPVGYTDGFRRMLSNTGQVLIRGKRVPIVGKVCMDQLMVDVTDVNAITGDEVVLIGIQNDEQITAEEIAHRLDTIVQEVLTLIGKRTARLHYKQGKLVAARSVIESGSDLTEEELT